jgi:hypothetical protein
MANVALGLGVSLGLNMLSKALSPTKSVFNQTETGKLEDVSTRKTGGGWTLAKVYGRVLIKGCPIIWAPPRREEAIVTSETESTGGGKGNSNNSTTTETTTYRYYGNFAFAICDGSVDRIVRISFNDVVWFNRDGELDSTIADNDYKLENYLTTYTGASDQNINTTIEEFEGNENGDKNMRHLVYCVVRDFPLDSLGGELPGTIDVVVERINSEANVIQNVIYEVCESVGLIRDVDVVAPEVGGDRINAIYKQDGSSAADFLNEIIQRYFLLSFTNADGQLQFIRADNASAITPVDVGWTGLGATEYGNEPIDPYDETIIDSGELPSGVSITYTDLNEDFNSNSEYRAYPMAFHYNPKSINTSLMMTSGDAKTWIWRYLEATWQQANRYNVKVLPEDGANLIEGQTIAFPLVDGQDPITFQIASVVTGANLIAECELYTYDGDIFTAQPFVGYNTNTAYTGTAIQLAPDIDCDTVVVSSGETIFVEGIDYEIDCETGLLTILPGGDIDVDTELTITYNAPPSTVVNPSNPSLEAKDYGEPIITIVETNRVRKTDPPCIYAAVNRDGVDFGQTTIFARFNGGSYSAVAVTVAPTTKGTLSGSMTKVVGLDETNTITVILDEGTLSPLSQNQFDNQEVILLVGEEQIVARDVTLVSLNTYELEYIQRGVNGTPPVAHVADELIYVVKGTSGQVVRLTANADAIGQTFDFKAVPIGRNVTDITRVTTYTVLGIYFKPYASIDATATKDSAGNITISWVGLNTGLNPLDPQVYEIDVIGGSTLYFDQPFADGLVLSLLYPVAQQIIDFSSAQSVIDVEIYQLSLEYGRGYVGEFELTPTLLDLPPIVDDFAPRQGDIDTVVTIYGSRFTAATSAEINGVEIDDFAVVSDTEITGTVATGTTTGKVEVIAPAGTGISVSDFVIVNGDIEWGQITGTLANQTDLQSVLARTRIYTTIVGNVTAPGVGATVDVTVAENYGFAPGVPVTLFRQTAPGLGGGGYAQLNCTAVAGNVLTLSVEVIGRRTTSSFLDGDLIGPIVEQTVGVYGGIPDGFQFIDEVEENQYFGTNADNELGYHDLPTGSIKAKNIESISATKTLILTDAYFQFLTPTVSSVIVKLPAVTGTDYYEGEIINAGTGTNALAIQENDGTAIITLSDAGDAVRSIYYYWDGTIWRVFERSFY